MAGDACIGIGKVARLPYLMGEYGGLVFLAAYVVALQLGAVAQAGAATLGPELARAVWGPRQARLFRIWLFALPYPGRLGLLYAVGALDWRAGLV